MKKIHSPIIAFCIAGAICLAATKAHAQNLVQNPGFETGTTFAPFWNLNDPNVPPPLSVIGVNPTFAHSGQHYAALGTFGAPPSPASLQQSLATVPGQAYTLSFWLAHDVTTPPPPVSNQFQVFFGGVLVQTLTNVGTFGYTQFSFAVTAAFASTSLNFVFVDGNDFFRLDDVSCRQCS